MRIIQVEEVLAKSGKDASKTILNTLIGRTLGEVSTEELLAARNAASDEDAYGGVEISSPPMLREVYAEGEEE